MLNWQDHGSKSLSVRKVGKVSMLIPSNNWIYVNRKGFSCSIWLCFNFCLADKIYKKLLYGKVMAKKTIEFLKECSNYFLWWSLKVPTKANMNWFIFVYLARHRIIKIYIIFFVKSCIVGWIIFLKIKISSLFQILYIFISIENYFCYIR